jgi:hypothetical protein
MTTSYKILGQALDYLKYSTNENTTTIVSKLKIKNTSYPGTISVAVSSNDSLDDELLNPVPLLMESYILKNKEVLFNDSIEISGGIIIDPNSSLIVFSESGEKIIIQLYGIEETI